MSPWINIVFRVVFSGLILYLVYLIAALFISGVVLSVIQLVLIILFILAVAEAVGMRR